MPETCVVNICPVGWITCDVVIGSVEIINHSFEFPWTSPKKIKSKLKIYYSLDYEIKTVPFLIIIKNHQLTKLYPSYLECENRSSPPHLPTTPPPPPFSLPQSPYFKDSEKSFLSFAHPPSPSPPPPPPPPIPAFLKPISPPRGWKGYINKFCCRLPNNKK